MVPLTPERAQMLDSAGWDRRINALMEWFGEESGEFRWAPDLGGIAGFGLRYLLFDPPRCLLAVLLLAYFLGTRDQEEVPQVFLDAFE